MSCAEGLIWCKPPTMTFDVNSSELIRWGLAALLVLAAIPLSSRLVRLLRLAATRSAGPSGNGVTTAKFLAEVLRVAILVGTALVSLSLAGVNTTSLAAILGAATLAIGLALQGTLANVAAGVLIVTLRLYRVGDIIETLGHTGTVRLVSLFTTELETFTGRQVLLPNGEVLKQPIVNVSRHAQRRIDVNVILAWDTDAQAAGVAALEELAKLEGVLADPAPASVISAFDPRGPLLSLRVWADRDHAGTVGLAAPLAAHRALQAGGFAMCSEPAGNSPQK